MPCQVSNITFEVVAMSTLCTLFIKVRVLDVEVQHKNPQNKIEQIEIIYNISCPAVLKLGCFLAVNDFVF